MKYRIVKFNGNYAIMYKWGWWWMYIYNGFDEIATFSTQKHAEDIIDRWTQQEKENGTVVKEISP